VADAAGLVLFALEDSRVQGPVNGTAPDVIRNRDFTRALAQAVGKPARFATPSLLLRLWLGVTVDTMLYGRHVVPQKAQELGYRFQFPTLEFAFRDLVDAEPDALHGKSRKKGSQAGRNLRDGAL
jgi:NAD dependent epimerase/dehydratase family enzyme